MPTDSKAEQVAAAIVTRLDGIVGDSGVTYWYTPTVVRADSVDANLLDASVEAVYALTPDRKERQRATNDGPGCIFRVRAFYTLTLLKPLAQESTHPFLHDGLRKETIQERMIADVQKRLEADASLGGVSTDLRITDTEENPNETKEDGWAVVFMRVAVTYHETKAAAA